MNKQRRKILDEATAGLELISAALAAQVSALEDLKEHVSDVLEEEREAFENMPESLQEGDRGQQMQAGIEALEEFGEKVDEVLEAIGDGGALEDMAAALQTAVG